MYICITKPPTQQPNQFSFPTSNLASSTWQSHKLRIWTLEIETPKSHPGNGWIEDLQNYMIDESKPETNHSCNSGQIFDAWFFYTSSSIFCIIFFLLLENLGPNKQANKKNTLWFATKNGRWPHFRPRCQTTAFATPSAVTRQRPWDVAWVQKSNFKTKWWTRIKKHPKTQNSGGGFRFSVWYLTTLTKGCLVSSHCNSLRRSLWCEAILSKDANPSIRDQQKRYETSLDGFFPCENMACFFIYQFSCHP